MSAIFNGNFPAKPRKIVGHSLLSHHSVLTWVYSVLKRQAKALNAFEVCTMQVALHGSFWPHCHTSTCWPGQSDPLNLHQGQRWWAAIAGMEMCLWHLGPPDLPWHGCYSDWGPAAGRRRTILVDDCNGGRLRLNALRYNDHYYE